MKTAFHILFCVIVFSTVAAGCDQPAASISIETPIITQIQATNTITPQPSATHTPVPTPTPLPTGTPTPGPNASFLYLADGSIQRYDLLTWTAEKIVIASDGPITKASLSPNQQFIAFEDQTGLKIVERPFTSTPTVVFTFPEEDSLPFLHFLFTHDSQSLAYSDPEGLKIYLLSSKTNRLVIAHKLFPSDSVDYITFLVYYPSVWSPDDQWLWISVAHYEHTSYLLANLSNNSIQDFSAYYGQFGEIDWLSDSSAFYTSVAYSGWSSCGEEDGIYFISTNSNTIQEKRVFWINSPADAYLTEPHDQQVNPQESHIAFIQSTDFLDDELPSCLYMVSADGSQAQILDCKQDLISSPIWSKDGEVIFFSALDQDESNIFQVDIRSLAVNQISQVPYPGSLTALSPDGKWILFAAWGERYSDWNHLFLINTHDGKNLLVSNFKHDNYLSNRYFILGWEYNN